MNDLTLVCHMPEGSMLPPQQKTLASKTSPSLQQDGSNKTPDSESDKDMEQASSVALTHPAAQQMAAGSCDEIDKQREKNRQGAIMLVYAVRGRQRHSCDMGISAKSPS